MYIFVAGGLSLLFRSAAKILGIVVAQVIFQNLSIRLLPGGNAHCFQADQRALASKIVLFASVLDGLDGDAIVVNI